MSETCLIVGGGHCAGQLAARLRAEGYAGAIRIVGEEPLPPYQRPPLSKQYLAGEVELDRVALRPEAFYGDNDIELVLGTRIARLDRDARTALAEDGARFDYDQVVLATGSRVRELTVPGVGLDGVHYLRGRADSDAIRARLSEGARLVVVGGGYIGLEVASVAARAGARVTVLEAEERLMKRVVAPETSAFFLDLHRDAGVDVRFGVQVSGFEGAGALTAVGSADGERLAADLAVVGVGIVPNVEPAAASGLAVDDGIVVDAAGRTEDPRVFAAGDCCSHPSTVYGRRVRLESVHNAMAQAKVVAANICGKEAVYDEVPWFWSDQYDVKLQIAGLAAGRDATVVRGSTADGAFTVFSLCDGVVIAAETVNGLRDHIACRGLVGARTAVAPTRLADADVAIKDLG